MCEVFILNYICIKYPRDKITDFLLCLLCVFLIILIFQFDNKTVAVSGSLDNLVMDFLKTNGWQLDEASLSSDEILFTFENSEALKEYSDLQESQGFLISEYIGKRVIRFSCNILNYPGYFSDNSIYANVFVFDDKIIAADICSVKIDGFLQGAIVNENTFG